MQNVDRLGWTAGIVLEAFGVELGVRSNDREVLDRLSQQLPAIWTCRREGSPTVQQLYSLRVGPSPSRAGTRNYHLLYAGAGRLARTLDLSEALEALRVEMLERVSRLSSRLVFLKAGVVRRNSRALLLAEESGSLLTEALLDRGARLVSDRFAVLDESCQACSLETAPGQDEFATTIAAVVFAQREENREFLTFSDLSRGEAALRLFGLSSTAALHPKRDLARTLELAYRTRVGFVRHGPVEEAASQLLELLESSGN